ncbi:MAG: type VI secretion system tube protein Hcp [Schlesneria sp.]
MILLQFKGDVIKGDSIIDGHTDWIAISSVQFGVGRGISSTTGGSDRETSTPSFSEVSLGKPTDCASTNLFAQAIYGMKVADTCTLDFIQTGGTDKSVQIYMQIILTNPIISSYSVSSGGDRPSESFSINFTKMVYKYTQFKIGGTPTAADTKGYNLQTGKPDIT